MYHDRREHLWIPDEQVVRLRRILRGGGKTPDVVPSIHGGKLSASLELIASGYVEARDKAIAEDLVLFKVTLQDEDKFDTSDRQKMLTDNGMRLQAIRDRTTAIVSTTRDTFSSLSEKVSRYRLTGIYRDFGFVDSFEPLDAEDKPQPSVRRALAEAKSEREAVDVQIVLMPRLDKKHAEEALSGVKERLTQLLGVVKASYGLSDGTKVIRALMPMMNLYTLSNYDGVYQVYKTNFYNPVRDPEEGISPNPALRLDPEVDLDKLPIVVVLDTGVKLPEPLDRLVVGRWDGGVASSDPHGTHVASRVAFGDALKNQCDSGYLRPHARIIDAPVIDSTASDDVLIKRIQEVVAAYGGIAEIYNLSVNAQEPIDGDSMSLLGAELDNLMGVYPVQFVVSSGNHNLWRTASSLEEVIGDDDSRIAPPADSMFCVTVGAVVPDVCRGSISTRNEVAPYSRIGPGFAGHVKSDVVAYSGNINASGSRSTDRRCLGLSREARLEPLVGTSFSSPIVAGYLARITAETPVGGTLLAKALLYNGARSLRDDEGLGDEERRALSHLYGRGLVDCERFLMPSILAAQPGRNTARIRVTCVSKPPSDKGKGTEYLCGFISASLHKRGAKDQLYVANSPSGRDEWDSCQHSYRDFSSFHGGDWEVWLELRTRWDIPKDLNIPYALVVTIEDLSRSLDIHAEALLESAGRFVPLSTLRIPITSIAIQG